MAAVTANDVWAVGITSPTHYFHGGLAAHWDGSKWTEVASPGTPGIFNSIDLFAVAAVPGVIAKNVWAVGDAGNVPLAAQWNGSGWNEFTPPSLPGGKSALHGVVGLSPTDVWAVGYGGPFGTSRTLIDHYDGVSWSSVLSPDSSPTSLDRLLIVSAISATDIWAVGDSQEGTTSHTLTEHWNGTSWSIVPSPNVGAGNNTLNAVGALSTSNAWAVGSWTDSTNRPETLTERWDGTSWAVVQSPTIDAGNVDNVLQSVVAVSPDNVWAAGVVSQGRNIIFHPIFMRPLVEHWDGQQWSVISSPDGQPTPPPEFGTNESSGFNAITAVSASNVWAGGDFSGPGGQSPFFENLCIPAPNITSVVPVSGNDSGGTAVAITGTDFTFATSVKFGASAAASFTIDSPTQITATSPAAPMGTVDVTVTNYGGTSATSPADLFVYVTPAVSWNQYRLTGNNGSSWVPIDSVALSVTITPTVNANAVLSGNADLWTALAGVNQDLGIFVSGGAYGAAPGTLVAWKESGGNAGTFSPNAAFVQTVKPVVASTTYTVTLAWKANHATSGTIFAGAGLGPAFSPTRLSAELVPSTDLNLQSAVSGAQYGLTGSNGSSWQDMDDIALLLNFTPAASGYALLSANADLWTRDPGVNQDLGIFVSGGAFGSGQIVGWKESGGNAGIFSPNAAFAQTVVQFVVSTPYVVKVQWKANHATPGTIYAGAGLGPPPNFSPTRLTLHVFPSGTGIQDATSSQQYTKAYSTGADWTPIDGTNLKLTVTPAVDSLAFVTGNADLFTASAGVNQDLGILITGGAFGSGGKLIAWKESGGFAGTFSPNAALVQTVISLTASTTYTFTLVWKANHVTTGTIFAGAGLGPAFSPTRITAQLSPLV